MRQPTPNILDELLPTKSETTELRSGLKWDYSQLGDAAGAVIEHTIEIKRNERRANEAVVEAGRHLIAVKDSLNHGQWGDWLATEFAMSDSTAQTMMNIARRFGANSQTFGNLSYSVLGLLASPSVPEAAVEQVVAASSDGKVSVADAKAIIDQHRPARPTASGLPAIDMPPPARTIQPGSPEAKALSKEIKSATWADRRSAPTSTPVVVPPNCTPVKMPKGVVDDYQAWFDPRGGDYVVRHGDTERRFAIWQNVIDAYPPQEEQPAPTPVVVDGERPLPQWATDDDDDDESEDASALRVVFAGRIPDHLVDVWSPRFVDGGVYLVDVVRNRSTETVALDDIDELFAQAERMDGAYADDDLTAADVQVLQPTPVAETAESNDRRQRLTRWWVRIMSMQNDLLDWGNLTGRHLATGETERGLRKMLEITQRELDILDGKKIDAWGEEQTA